MDLQIAGRTALVTGSTAGIGYATAAALAAEGVHVTLNGRTQERVDAAVAKIKSALPAAHIAGFAGDLSKAAVVDRLLQQLPAVDILINNLGIFEPKDFFDIPDEDWTRFFEVNVLSGVRLSRLYMPAMLKKNWGRVVFVSSESGLQIPAEMIHYGMTKTAQLAVARGLAELTAGTNVTVNSALPGPTSSEGVETFVRDLAKSQNKDTATFEKEFFAHARPSSLLKRFITPEEVASTITYLCSPHAAATNGASVRIDGGVVRSIG